MQPHCPHCGDGGVPKSIRDYFKNIKTMTLAKALKEKKRLAGEIAQLKMLIHKKNSYIEGSETPQKFNVDDLYSELMSKIQKLVNLKIAINHANKEIQSSIYLIAEYKAMISYLNSVNVTEGQQETYRSGKDIMINYMAQMDEVKRNELVKEFQTKADSIQDQIDAYNYVTEIVLDELPPEEK